jgi:tetratricopeptide (TPR) repeat protein
VSVRALPVWFFVVLAVITAGCATAKVTPPGDPLRPPPQKLPAVVTQTNINAVVKGPVDQAPQDCEAQSPDQGPPPKSPSGKDLDEAARIASAGLRNLIDAEQQTRPASEVTSLIEQAVSRFLQSLALDPLNVKATYNLSAAYARMGRNQCALNLVARLAAMDRKGLRKKDVVDAFQRIYGSGGKWKGQADPDFQILRTDKRLTDLVPPPSK